MAVRSRDFVGIAEGIRSHELSTKSQIENLKGHMSELSGRRSSLNSTISYLEAAIAAAYEDTDEDGDPDYGLIASLEAQKSSAENELSGVENDLDSTGNELENKQNELETVEEEKAQTLFEIQERARKTSNNISLAGGMYGAYAGVGGTLQNSLQTSLSSLTQAAGILGGSVDGASGGSLGGPSGSGNAASGEVGTSLGDYGSGTGPLSAFTGGYSVEALPLSASQFSTNQDQLSTPATMPNYHSGQGSINTRAPQSFSTEQGANEYALSSFGDVTAPQVTSQSADGYRSNQASQNMESQFVPTDSSAPGASSSSPGNRQHSFADWLNPDNYTEDGHYIGEGQSWGYNPYGNDTSKYAATIMTPAQQALNSYMQAHNYGKGDFAAYSKDAEWQRLHKAAHPASGLADSLKGTALARQHLTEYMYAHNYTQADFATFSRDAEWQRLHQMAYPDSGVVAALVGSELARQHLREYMNEHNYSQADYAIYSKDPEWQRLHRTAYPTAIANGKMTKRSISVTDADTVNAKIKDRAHEFFGHFIGGTKGTSSTEHSASRPINQILAGAYDSPAKSEAQAKTAAFTRKIIAFAAIAVVLILAAIFLNASSQEKLTFIKSDAIGSTYSDTSGGSVMFNGDKKDRITVKIIDDDTLSYTRGNYTLRVSSKEGGGYSTSWNQNEIYETAEYEYTFSTSLFGKITLEFNGRSYEVEIDDDDGTIYSIEFYED